MTRQRNCRDCKKQLTGKYWLITGIPHNDHRASRANYCASCCDKWKNKDLVKDNYLPNGYTKFVEKEVADQREDEISEFEDKWEKHCQLGIKKNYPDTNSLLNTISYARQELTPYLQKPKIVKKAFEKEYDINNMLSMCFYYLFVKEASEEEYKKAVVRPTVEKILGGKLDEEINTELEGYIPGFSAGRADGDFKINGKLVAKYWWVDGDEDVYRRLMIIFLDNNKLALQAFLRSLDIKEKELKKELPEQQKPDKPNNNPQWQESGNHSSSVKPTNQTLIISLIIGGALFILGIVIFLIKTKKRKVK